MSFLSTAVYSSVTWRGLGFFEYDTISYKAKSALKAVTKRQRRKFKKYGVVPIPVLEAFWHLGFLPGAEVPGQGMEVSVLLDYLSTGSFEDQISSDKSRWLYEKIVKDELVGPVSKPYRKP